MLTVTIPPISYWISPFTVLSNTMTCHQQQELGDIEAEPCLWCSNFWLMRSQSLLHRHVLDVLVSPTSVLVALFLLTLQSWHRFYETWFISIYSNSYINIYHYIIGYGHYFGSVMAVLCESPGFINNQEQRVQLNFGDISFLEVIGVTTFLWACYNQYRSAIILANLRKNKNGQVVTTKHSIPYGGWFELVSSPHFLAEILMYMAISIILRAANTWHVVFLWVLSNQVESGLLSHWWYKATFPNYPKERKAVIPYVL
ncbi:polyprenol reductase isoform X2 [Schistocerca serialis cubense]|uniref:polyprenol reductase isoform X2 n=1 Tax=Schistocerca serialis cubense TaxID=2023355 RepID=UPI00214E304A|nr:polyprenol reductase isoform X2 [Schistocerca serialis cubense]